MAVNKFLLIFFADQLGGIPGGLNRRGQATAGLDPLTGHIKIS